jgi:hypothetical protein
MKLIVLLVLVLACINVKEKSTDNQSIQLSPNKLLITDNKPDLIPEPENSIEKDISAINFSSRLKDAESALFRKLSNNYLKTDPKPRINYIPTYRIDKLNTVVDLKTNKTFAEIKEKVTFTLENGIFSSLSRKISLAGSSDSLLAFRLTSSDVKLKQAKVVPNCLEEEYTSNQYPYVCVIAIFEEIDAKAKPLEVDIEYEYLAQDIIRSKEVENKNSIIWYYDNFKKKEPIYNITFKLKIDSSLLPKNDTSIIGYPEKFTNSTNAQVTEFTWNIEKLNSEEFKNIYLEIPKSIDTLKIRKLVKVFNLV